ncbi:EAL domain-containing protein [Frankia sp. B2]|uniref:Diguanylate cyclase/phosphodiesterase n=2 Tax=Frankia casuarinae (strain DSM 45818 / CECT 9043 / HFP020203 / CcI3) TaxID=106370 RepID=Q2J6X3_FRACC|nr:MULTISPECIES: EAL domain-containing protein [unclassified Frankia]ABD12969.1 diguanylate cyclase/phosphodiesterase [Frankia casuarinae]ETA03574.1 diguanylate cyclase/phosphodiesterase [Frankia sp. CcI6]TFE31334.1 EAL domain-containing protein [Frankia sp. B2]
MLVDAAAIAAGLTATLSCARAGRRLGRVRGRWLVWLSFALATWTVGQAGWMLHRWDGASVGGRTATDAGYLTDAGQLAMPVLALAAFAAVPAGRARRSRPRAGVLAPAGMAGLAGGTHRWPPSSSRLTRVAGAGGEGVAAAYPRASPATAFDEVILGNSLFLLAWSGVLAGIDEVDSSRPPQPVEHLLAVAHPIVVLLLIIAFLHVAGFRQPVDLPAVAIAGTGLVCLAVAGVWIVQLDGRDPTMTGSCSVAGALLIVLAASRAGRGDGRENGWEDGRRSRRWPVHGELLGWLWPAVPYVAAAVVAALLLGRAHGGVILDPVEIIGGATLVLTVLVRQLTTLRVSQRLASRVGEAEHEVRHWTSHDPLTELANRTLFHQRLTDALAASRHDGRDVAVLYCDLDDFRVVNDSLGHAAGDHLLRAVGQRLRHCVGTSDTVARLGSDEFAVLLDGGRELPETVAERVLAALRQPAQAAGHLWPVRGSVGLVVACRTQETTEALLRRADTAVHTAKRTGKNRLVVYRPGLCPPSAGTHLADALATALRRGGRSAGFDVHYQPIVRLRDRSPVALEALARWTEPGRGPVPPGTFVAAAEDGGIVGALDDMVLTQACAEVAVAYPASALRLHVNVSASRIADTTLLDSVAQALAASRFDPGRLVVEITETSRIDDLRGAREVLNEVRALGVAVALDDVGAGHSTLAALHQLPVDVVKLDRTLLEPPPRDGHRVATMRRSMISLAHALGAVVVAEGIEREGQIAELEELGCELGQGYFFARPGPLASLTIRRWVPPTIPGGTDSPDSAEVPDSPPDPPESSATSGE